MSKDDKELVHAKANIIAATSTRAGLEFVRQIMHELDMEAASSIPNNRLARFVAVAALQSVVNSLMPSDASKSIEFRKFMDKHSPKPKKARVTVSTGSEEDNQPIQSTKKRIRR